jgi:hypothetical protein
MHTSFFVKTPREGPLRRKRKIMGLNVCYRISHECVYWIERAQNKLHCQAVAKIIMNLRIP